MAFPVNMFEDCDGLFICLASWVNDVTYDVFWSLGLIAFGIILFMATFNFGVNRAFGYATISMALLSILLIQANLISQLFLTIFIIVGIIGVVAMVVGER